MNPEIKADWLTALRSGAYKQGRGFLKYSAGDGARYCCLGVLCELAAKAGIIEGSEDDGDDVHRFQGQTSYLPSEVAQWADIHYQGKIYRDSEGRVKVDLADLNDYKMDFYDIAEVIEEEF